jgi:DNA-binding transcriptional ArsR family regulator
LPSRTLAAPRSPPTSPSGCRGASTRSETPGARPRSPSAARIRSTLATIVDQPDELRQLRLVHKALADVNRLRIVQRLALAQATVTQLIEHVGLSQPLVSWHVGKLRTAGLVQTRRVGRETICSVRPEAFSTFADHERDVLGLDRAPADGAPAAEAPDAEAPDADRTTADRRPADRTAAGGAPVAARTAVGRAPAANRTSAADRASAADRTTVGRAAS